MIRDATRADLPLIRELFRRANDIPYDLAAVAEEKCFGEGFRGTPRVRLFGEEGVAVTCGDVLRVLAVDREHRSRGIGSALLADSGARVIGAEAGNYFVPGVPPEMVNWLTKRGYREKSRTHNLTVDLAHVDPDRQECLSHTALEFIERHFGAIWRFEASRAAALLFIEEVGFAAIEANNRGLGTFGPIGVAPEARGRGHGRTLLLAALAELRRRGYTRAIIPWTDAMDFYRKSCGAQVELELVTMVRG